MARVSLVASIASIASIASLCTWALSLLATSWLATSCTDDAQAPSSTAAPGDSPTGGSSTSSGSAGQGGSAGGGGQLTGGAGGAGGWSAGGQGGAVTDFSQEGPYSYAQNTGQVDMPGCGVFNKMDYSLFVPAGGDDAPLVVLGHGFNRSRDKMVLLAHHLATYGLRVVTIDYCHLKLTDLDHQQNAVDQKAVATAFAGGAPVIYAGYSAGGLSSLLAASTDSQTVALLLLDAVEKDGLGQSTAPSVSVPTFGLVGEPSVCNSQNGGGVYLAKYTAGGWSARVTGATHCDFEGPTDSICTLACNGEGTLGQRGLIRTLATAFIAWQAGIDPSGQDWVRPTGSHYQALENEGAIQTL